MIPESVLTLCFVWFCSVTCHCARYFILDKPLKMWTLCFCFCKILKSGTEDDRGSSEKRQLNCDSVGFVQWRVYSIHECLCPCMCGCVGASKVKVTLNGSAALCMCVYPCRYLWCVCDGAYRLNPPPSERRHKHDVNTRQNRKLSLMRIHVHVQSTFSLLNMRF